MAKPKIATTMTIVDPFDELSDVAAANERLAAGLSILSDHLFNTLFGGQRGEEIAKKEMQNGWHLLELLRETHRVTISERTREAEKAFFAFTDAYSILQSVEAQKAAA